jgi:3-hydroxybutyryl-CoA dehydrogenase
MGALDPSRAVAVVGSGTMGGGIAEVAALAGHPVLLYDVEPARADRALADLAARLDRAVARGRVEPAARDTAVGRVRVVKHLDDLAPAALVVEAAVESLEVKREIFARLDQVCGPDAVLASNTSSISLTAIGAAMEHPERLAGMHFFNPAPVMKLVEVVSGLATDRQVAETVAGTARAWGKVPVHTASTPGFVVNRVARPFYGEALRVYEERGADPATVDAVLRESGGFRMGPFALMDLIGLDVNLAVSTSVWQAFAHDPRYTPSATQRELVDAGRLGRKTGHGWYRYGEAAPAPAPATAAPVPAPAEATVRGQVGRLARILPRLREAGVGLRETGQAYDDREPGIELPEGGLLSLTDGRPATAVSAELRRPVVCLDLALDFGTATRFALAASDGCPARCLDAAVGLLQATGAAVSVLDDVPGLVVARTVAMLVNEAAEVVGRGVATAADVDLAMRHGVNYPVGPVEWGERLGAGYVVRLLDTLAAYYADGRYRPAPWLRRRALTGGPA